MPSSSQAEKAARFAAMHREGCFILPNAWDVPSAALIVEAGFEVLATTSAGVAFANGLPDGEKIGRERMLEVAGAIARRVPVPVTADLEAGYGSAPEAVAETVRLAIEAGLVGCNIEDSDPATGKLLDPALAAERIRAGAAASRAAGLGDFVLNARIDPFLMGFGSLEENFAESVRRANAALEAGASSVFVPGPVDEPTITRLVAAIPGPLNVMAVSRGHAPPLETLRRLGVRRVSVGGSLMLATYGACRRILDELRANGEFGYAARVIPHREMNALMTKYREDG
jgi:2-methylisocitrate lyase-like PEP mutase family enzyme